MFATDDTGVKVWGSIYLPFGGVLTSTGTPIALRFPGQWFQSESGLHQNWMRDYDPTTGRYMQADPLGLVDGASVYGYARGNPGRYTDPRGEFIPPVIACLVNPICRAAVGAAIGVIIGYFTDDDGCYSVGEGLTDAALGGAAAWGLGKSVAPVFRPTGPFGKGTWMNTGQHWRLGWGKHNGRWTFRFWSRITDKIDFFDGGSL